MSYIYDGVKSLSRYIGNRENERRLRKRERERAETNRDKAMHKDADIH